MIKCRRFSPLILLCVLSLVYLADNAFVKAGPVKTGSNPSSKYFSELKSLIENVGAADGVVYDAHDSIKQNMDGAKIIQDKSGEYLAVYHTFENNRPHLSLASSKDLINWQFICRLGKIGQSQPYICQLQDNSYLVAAEQEEPPSAHVSLMLYANRQDLNRDKVKARFDAPRTLALCEGTPNIYSVRLNPDIFHSSIDIGAHYYRNKVVDRQQRAKLTNFSTWQTVAERGYDQVIERFGVKGNIGDRDFINYKTAQLGIIEGMGTIGDWSSWRCYLYDFVNGHAEPLSIKTRGGSRAFANPAITNLRLPDGTPAVVVTLFIPSQGSAAGEAGQLIYFRRCPR